MARNFYRFFTENNRVMGDSKTFGIPEAKGLRFKYRMKKCILWGNWVSKRSRRDPDH